MKTSPVTPSFYCVFNISLSCNYSTRSFIGNLSMAGSFTREGESVPDARVTQSHGHASKVDLSLLVLVGPWWYHLVLLFARYTKRSAVAIFWDENSFRPRYSSCCSCGAFRVTSWRLVQQMLTKRFELGPVATVFTDLKCWPFRFAADIADLTLNG